VKHARTSAAGTGAVHALSAVMVSMRGPYGSLCGTSPTSAPNAPRESGKRFTARWHRTDEPVSCRRCLSRMEQLAEQALRDEDAIGLLRMATGRADGDRVRAFRRAWPAMGRAVADLLRHRGVQLGEGWLGPARITESTRP
jgi:hypothetical protein